MDNNLNLRTRPYICLAGADGESFEEEFAKAGISFKSNHVPAIELFTKFSDFMNIPFDNDPKRAYAGSLLNICKGISKFAIPIVNFEPSPLTQSMIGSLEYLQNNTMGDLESSLKVLKLSFNSYPSVSAEEIRQVKQRFPKTEIILNIGYGTTGQTKGEMPEKYIKDCGDAISQIVIAPYDYNIDPAYRDEGEHVKLEDSLENYRKIKRINPRMIIGFAGIFNSDNIQERLGQVIDSLRTTDFSINCGGGLRNKDKDYGSLYDESPLPEYNHFNDKRVKNYLKTASKELTNRLREKTCVLK